MKCPYCNKDETNVIDSREAEDKTSIRRRRSCSHCGKRFTTYERVEGIDLKVLKKDGVKENFCRDKLKKGLTKATWKRPISMSTIDELIDEVERNLRQRKSSEVKSWEIGNLVINRLRKIDKLSYLLFASVYRDFDSIEDFQKELERLNKGE
jgi:transcriptional repressor NrdR